MKFTAKYAVFFLLAAAWQTKVYAETIYVGSGEDCDFAEVVQAVEYAVNQETPTLIRLTRSSTITKTDQVVITNSWLNPPDSVIMSIEGGYRFCGQPEPDGYTTFNRANKETTLFSIIGAGGGQSLAVALRRIAIEDAQNATTFELPAIDVAGDVSVSLKDSFIGSAHYENSALTVRSDAELYVENTTFAANTSDNGGAALHCLGDDTRLILGDNTHFQDNISRLNGGALLVEQCSVVFGALINEVNRVTFERNASTEGSGGAIATINGGRLRTINPVSSVLQFQFKDNRAARFGGCDLRLRPR